MEKISILTPTRSRPKEVIRFIKSVYDTTEIKDNVEIQFYVDSNDPCIIDYMNINDYPGFVKFLFAKPQSISKSWNQIAKISEGDILIMGNDDLVYKTPGWDNILREKLTLYSDNIYVAWFNDMYNGEKHCAFPIISRKMFDILGYFTPGIFEFLCNDTWMFDIGKRINRTLYISEVITEHLHFALGKSSYDETYKRHRVSGATKRDLELFNNTADKRAIDAQKLLDYTDRLS